MTKFLTITILCFLIQYSPAQKLDCYLGIGANLNYLHQKTIFLGGEERTYNSRLDIGPNLGLRMDYSLNKHIAIGSGLSYINKSNITSKLHYVSLPVLFKLAPVEKFVIDLGGDFERLVYAKQYGEDVTSIFNKNDIGLIAGLNYNFFKALRFSMKYYHSVKNFYRVESEFTDTDNYNRCFLFLIEYNILKK